MRLGSAKAGPYVASPFSRNRTLDTQTAEVLFISHVL